MNFQLHNVFTSDDNRFSCCFHHRIFLVSHVFVRLCAFLVIVTLPFRRLILSKYRHFLIVYREMYLNPVGVRFCFINLLMICLFQLSSRSLVKQQSK